MIKLVLGEVGIGWEFFVYGFDLGREIYFSLQSSIACALMFLFPWSFVIKMTGIWAIDNAQSQL